MLKSNEIAKGVRVKLNSNFILSSLSRKYLACEPILYIYDGYVYNDAKGKYLFVRGGSHVNSDAVYLEELELEFPITEQPLYSHEEIDYSQDLSRFKREV